MMRTRRSLAATASGLALATAAFVTPAAPASAQSEPLTVGMGDIASVESLNLLIAMERAGERGVPMELTFFNSEDVAVQAVVGGQADIGVGAPYAFIQNSGVPVRLFYRMSTLLFFPVVDSEVYSGWDDLDGQEVTVHSRGSGTEALMRLMEQIQGIEYSNMSYVPGSEVRAGAMLNDTIDATIVDAAAFRLLQQEGGDRFQRLPVEGVDATDEALYTSTALLEERHDDLVVFAEELLRTWRDIAEDPSIVAELRERYDLLPDLPEAAAADITPYYTNAVENGVYPLDGGSPENVRADLEFLAAAGQVEAPGDDFEPSAYWDFGPLRAARANLGIE